MMKRILSSGLIAICAVSVVVSYGQGSNADKKLLNSVYEDMHKFTLAKMPGKQFEKLYIGRKFAYRAIEYTGDGKHGWIDCRADLASPTESVSSSIKGIKRTGSTLVCQVAEHWKSGKENTDIDWTDTFEVSGNKVTWQSRMIQGKPRSSK